MKTSPVEGIGDLLAKVDPKAATYFLTKGREPLKELLLIAAQTVEMSEGKQDDYLAAWLRQGVTILAILDFVPEEHIPSLMPLLIGQLKG